MTTRREWLFRHAAGFGGLALGGLLGCNRGPGTSSLQALSQLAGPASKEPRARSVIFLYMDGGPSQMDTFDPKPRLDREHGQPIKMKTPATNFNIGNSVMKSPFKFRKHGECGADVSSLFPHVAECVDHMTIIRSMVSDHGEHGAASYFMHTGHPIQGRPSMGAWAAYGLGTECAELPGFVVLQCGMFPFGGMPCFSNGFLPAKFRGSVLRATGQPLPDLAPREADPQLQANKRALLNQLNQQAPAQIATAPELEQVIQNYELAFHMQAAVPQLVDLSAETADTLSLYGIDEKPTALFGTECLMARKLVEQGVRFIELLPPKIPETNHWDQHSFLATGHRDNALAVDKPIAGLLKDLHARGLLDQTLVLWGGEFGRTPMAQSQPRFTDGRDHNPFGFTMWLAGGGVKGGLVYGSTDEYGYYAQDNPVHVHDLHATILHLMGVDHTELTYRHGGRDYRLTDVYGEIVRDILA
jgi:hypothetical protein